ncbi:hypothetical protein P8452_25211 [Trifolium repens]|nr:hypothetical protein P8452_25211 [Trifolium repens]
MLQTFSKDPPDEDEGYKEQLRWSTEWIKGCGALPVYSLKHARAIDGCSNINVEIVELKLKSKAQDTDESAWYFQNDIDDLQPRAIGGEVRSSNVENEYDTENDDDFDWLLENDIDENENEEDQEQPSYSPKEEEQLCCSIGLLLRHLLRGSKE